MTEIQGKSILVRVSARFELGRVRVIESRLYVHNDIGYSRSEQCHSGPVAQYSLVLGTKFEQLLIH